MESQTREYLAYRELQAKNEYLLELVVSFKTIFFVIILTANKKTGKTGTHFPADASPVQCSLAKQTKTHIET